MEYDEWDEFILKYPILFTLMTILCQFLVLLLLKFYGQLV